MNIASKAFKKTLPSTASVTIGHTTESERTEAAVPTVGNIAGREATSTVSPALKVPAPADIVSPAPKVPEDVPVHTGPPDVAPETPSQTVAPVKMPTPASSIATANATTVATAPASKGCTVAPVDSRPALTIAAAPGINGHTMPTTPAPVVGNTGVAAASESTFEIFLHNPEGDEANNKDAAPAAAAYHPTFVSARHTCSFFLK